MKALLDDGSYPRMRGLVQSQLNYIEATLSNDMQAMLQEVDFGRLLEQTAQNVYTASSMHEEASPCVSACLNKVQVYARKITSQKHLDLGVKGSALVTLAFCLRDAVLGYLKRRRISSQGAFLLIKDMEAFTSFFEENENYTGVSAPTQVFEDLKMLAQLFLIPHASVQDMRVDNVFLKMDPDLIDELLLLKVEDTAEER